MASKQIERAVAKIAEKVRTGKKVVYGEIMKESGYSDSVSKMPEKLTKTKTYIKMAVPLIDGLQEQITKIKVAMLKKDLDKEEFRILVGSLDVLTKNYQLLSGGATERQVFVMPSEIMDRNAIEATNEDVKQLENGSN